ncbi:lysylphosphatidylglycerol synthase domain-containing protein [Acidithiobacillus thiooxidans]|nr:lysylphosphatidylglycerol synthase domain-containing protein [Acidithiobacillus thiooxidans]MDX5936469.1 lysylphosphatidylglycerol synthase domain-containing protein [Acidithiobacillus thiooxidans]
MKQKMLILLAGLLGLALGVYLVLHAGFAGIVALLAVAGWGLLWLLPFHLLPLALDTLSWKWLLRGKARAPFGFLLWLALIRESVNGLLPVARIGGELLGIRMLSQYGVSPYVAGASVMVEITLTLVSQFLFALLGVVVLLFAVSNHLLVFEVLGFLFLSIPVLVIFFWLQKHKGLFSLVQNISKQMLDGYDVLGIIGDPRLLDAEIRSFYDKGRALLVANFWQLAGLFAGTLEVVFTFWLLHHPVPFWAALLLESLGQALRSVAFVVPAGIGIQEGGFMLFGTVVGIGPDLALAYALARRLRELFLGVPVLLSWVASESHYMRRRWLQASTGKEGVL